MNADVKALWIEALVSGEYEQTDGTLSRTTSEGIEHCCLGVLCQVAIKEGVAVRVDRPRELGAWAYDNTSTSLPEAVETWAGLHSPDPILDNRPASLWNDAFDATFNDIAALIETYL